MAERLPFLDRIRGPGPEGERLRVVVSYADNQSQCYVRLPFADLGGRT